jgi:hypothetical protein
MRLRKVVRLLAPGLLVVLGLASVSQGCSRQSEGERCDSEANGDLDCNDGLICKRCGDLQERVVDRCCPPGTSYSDPRCEPAATPGQCLSQTGTGGSGGGGGTGGSSTGVSGEGGEGGG